MPTIYTFWLSLQKVDLLRAEGEFVGLENYTLLFSDPNFGQTLGFTIFSLLIRLLVVAIVPLLLAWAISQFGRPVRLGLRVVLTLPLVLFVPMVIAITWVMALHPVTGLFASETYSLINPNSAPTILLFIDALYTFGLACGLGLIFYLPIWRRPADAPPPTFKETFKPLLFTWSLCILAITVLTLSTFTLNFAMTGGGPRNSTRTIGLWLYQFAFNSFRFGPAASLASIILLVTLGLGIVAGLLLLLTRLRLAMVNTLPPVLQKQQTDSQRSKVLPSIVLALTLLLTLGACSLSVLPIGWLVPQSFDESGFTQLLEQISIGRILVNTFIPPFVTAVVQLLLAYLAALSLGALQPLGKRSEWLLLAFSPWLFVTFLPLSLVSFMAARESGTINTFVGLFPPILFSVPTLFILTIFFKGQASPWQTASTNSELSKVYLFFKYLILPSLPLAGVLLLFLLLIGWQDVFWPLLVTSNQEHYTLGLVLFQLLATTFTASNSTLAAAVTLLIVPISIFFFIVLTLFQILYLDRLVLYTAD